MTAVLFSNATVIASLLIFLWVISLALRNAGIIDAFWGPGFATVAWNTWRFSDGGPVSFVVPVLVSVWGIRLGVHLGIRNHGKPEDFRYAAMRAKHGNRFAVVSLFTVFLLQGCLLWFISLPIQLNPFQTGNLRLLAGAGFSIWFTGFLMEAVADWQLQRFRSDALNSGRILTTGLWRYTRHPNYFGDFCVWWGIWTVCLAQGTPIWTVASPITMSILLMFISGVTLLEKTLKNSKPGYEEYARTTSAFFPMWPRHSKNSKL